LSLSLGTFRASSRVIRERETASVLIISFGSGRKPRQVFRGPPFMFFEIFAAREENDG
jgi:hypothetical protein